MKDAKKSKEELFYERMRELLGKDFEAYEKTLSQVPMKSIRVNTIKISPEKLKKMLLEKGWKINQPYKDFPEILIVNSELNPGELGRSLEHLLGYYYVQDISSMIPSLALNPKPQELVLDLCASPGSKTSQMAAMMKNKGTIIANEIKLGRVKILASNLERLGVSNTIITKSPGENLCKKIKNNEKIEKFDKILIDAPCSGEGTIKTTRSKNSKDSLKMWNPRRITSLSKIQKRLIISALEVLKPGGELVYSTCTFAPEENESVVDFIINSTKDVKLVEIKNLIPKNFKIHEGINKWMETEFGKEVKKTLRILPQDNNTEGFFVAKLRKAL